MRYRAKCACPVFVLVAVTSMVLTPLYGWGPIAHYEITKDAVGAETAQYAQLPDYTKSWQWVGDQGEFADIDTYFCWGHAALDAGDIAGVTGIPLAPVYPDDGRYPGPVMWELIQNKLTGLDPYYKAEAEMVAKGFRTHNAADRVVHFDYFLWPGPDDDWLMALIKWYANHKHKEKWADYQIYIKNNFDGNASLAFDGTDRLVLTPEYAVGIPRVSPNEAVASIMQLAQKVHRKNRYPRDVGQDYFDLDVQTISEIMSLLATQHENLSNYAMRYGADKNYRYYKGDFDSLNDKAITYGWSLRELDMMYERSKTAVRTWVNSLQ